MSLSFPPPESLQGPFLGLWAAAGLALSGKRYTEVSRREGKGYESLLGPRQIAVSL